jgi:hypothetical protein
VQPTVNFPSLDTFIKNPSLVLSYVDFSNPFIVLFLGYLGQQLVKKFNKISSSITESLFFSQEKDRQINNILQILRESLLCDRVVLGLIINGEKAIGEQYHLRKLVVTHENRAPNVSSAIKNKEHRFSLSVLTKEAGLYTEKKDWVLASIEDKLDMACRRYLDSIETHTIFTLKMTTKVKGVVLDIGYLSFQWLNPPEFDLLRKDTLSNMLEDKFGKDLVFYQNQLINIILSGTDRRSFFSNLGKMLTLKYN